MQFEYDKKTREATIKLTINPDSTQPSSTGKTIILGSDGGKVSVDGVEARVQVNVTKPAGGAKKAKRK